MSKKKWVVYLVRCSDSTLYCGISNDLKKRVEDHNSGKGAKYTRSRRPVVVTGISDEMTKSKALKLENKIKQLPTNRKIRFVHHVGLYRVVRIETVCTVGLRLIRQCIKTARNFIRVGLLTRIYRDIKMLFPLIRDYWKGNYRDVSVKSIVIFVATLAYIISPIDQYLPGASASAD
jgi:putative endonuclease